MKHTDIDRGTSAAVQPSLYGIYQNSISDEACLELIKSVVTQAQQNRTHPDRAVESLIFIVGKGQDFDPLTADASSPLHDIREAIDADLSAADTIDAVAGIISDD